MQTAAVKPLGAEDDRPRAQRAAANGDDRADDANVRHGDWLAAVARGDEGAFAALYEATLPRVFSLVRRICADAALAEEVTADAYVQVWRSAASYDATRGVALAWMLTIARTRALDALRRRDPAQTAADPHALADEGDRAADPLELLAAFEAQTATRRALAALPARERQLIALAFLRGHTHAEIAAATGWPLGTVKTTIRRALAALRAALAGDDAGPNTETIEAHDDSRA